MLKSKLSLIIYGILIMVNIASPKEGNAANMSDKDFYDSYNALLAPYASRTIQSKLGPSHQYSLTDAKVIKITDPQNTLLILLSLQSIELIQTPITHQIML